MKKQSVGILLYRKQAGRLECFLVHPGGPLWTTKEAGVWSIPKGEYDENELPLAAAKREFEEETSFSLPSGEIIALSPITQKSGKVVTAFAVEGDVDPEKMISNTCHIEWPPRSGTQMEIPECDRGGWFGFEEAKIKINPAQIPLLEELTQKL